MISHPIRLGTAALLLFAVSGVSSTASAQSVCQQVEEVVNNIPTTRTICTTTPDFFRDQGVLDRRNHLDSGSYSDVARVRRPKDWPLGPPSIQDCRFCLTPDAQNAARLKALQ